MEDTKYEERIEKDVLIDGKKSSFWLMLDITLVVLAAILYGIFSYTIIYQRMANENIFHSYLYNVIFILIAIIADKLARVMLAKLKQKPLNSKFGAIVRQILYAADFELLSLKSGLYLFYMATLIFSKIIALDPPFEVPYTVYRFITFVEYGLVLLVAFDKFVDQFTKADKYIKGNFKEIVRIKKYNEEH